MFCVPAAGQANPSSVAVPSAVDRWVAGLGAEDYLLRVKSEEEILRLGSAAIAAIEIATESPDIEISIRANRLLATLVRQDFEARKKRFLAASAQSLGNFGFQQWDEFSNWVGRSDRAKRLFIDIQQNRRDDKLPHGASNAVSFLGYLSAEQQQYTPLPSTAVEVADELLNRLTKIDRGLTTNQNVVLQQLSLSGFEANLPKTLVKTVRESEYADEIRTMIARWIGVAKTGQGLTGNQIELIYQFELPGFVDDLNAVLEDGNSKVRLQAAEAIAKTGGSDAVSILKRFIEGNQVIVAYPEPVSGRSLAITLGDIAFQLILALEGQPIKDFGFLPTAGTMLLSESPVYGFADRDAANQAVLRWESQR